MSWAGFERGAAGREGVSWGGATRRRSGRRAAAVKLAVSRHTTPACLDVEILAPTFDHAVPLGAHETEATRTARLTTLAGPGPA